MKKLIVILFICIISLMSASNIFAQTFSSVQWKCTEPDSQKVSSTAGNVTGFPEIGSAGFAVRDYSKIGGPIGNYQRWWPYDGSAAVSWGNETAQVDTRYIQFALVPNSGFKFHADSVRLNLGGGGTSHLWANISYSKTYDFTSATQLNSYGLSLANNADSLYSFVINADINDGDTIYVRVYPWYDASPSTSKYIYIQDVNIFGTTDAVSNPASATWELSDPGTGGTGQTVSKSGPIDAFDEYLNNMRINLYSGAESSQRLDNRTNGITQWPASQTTRIDSEFVQFAVTPKSGTSFTAKNISFQIGGNSSNYLKAEVLWSFDSTFATYGKIPDSLILEGADYAYPGYLLRADTLREVSYSFDTLLTYGNTLYVRVFPWIHDQTSGLTGKYLLLKGFVISGDVTGTVTYDPPTLTTTAVTGISDIFASSGGNISTDGGAPVTARGVCWSTNNNPTVADNKTSDGTGSGTFNSSLTGLNANTTYYVRAYATNIAGTAYGNEVSFTTLAAVGVPTVTTTSPSNVLTTTAKSGGNVTDWGGDTVEVKGVCWSTSNNPTISDNKTENGSGLGSFTSILYGLTPNTKFYVRAYATNSSGTGYGNLDSLTTQTPAPDITKIVDKNGGGDYTTVQAAFNDVPDNYTGTWTIFVKKGTYHEKLMLPQNKENVILKGEDRDSTILTYDDYAGIVGGTSNSYSVSIDGDDFTAMDITFQNTVVNDGSKSDQQAVALSTNGDRQQFYNCKLLGYQDTYYARGSHGTGRVYMKNCYIEGAVDFIFGRDVVVFDSCEIHVNRNQCSITAASTEATSNFGFVFRYCTITNDSIDFQSNVVNTIYLGRAWNNKPRTVFMYTYEPDVIAPAAWNPTAINSGVSPALYAVYQNTGPGYDATQHASGIGRLLTDNEAADYTLSNIFAKTTSPDFGYDWVPELPSITSVDDNHSGNNIPESFELFQNYPNPFNPSTIIKYGVPQQSLVKITLYDILGRQVSTIVNEQKSAGTYLVNFDASNLASGIYFYRIEAGKFVQTKKMILLK